MRDLFLLFVRYGGFLLFLLLESLSFWLIVRYNEEQRAIFDNSINLIVNKIDDRLQRISDYLSLADINEQLATQNAALLDSLLEQKAFIQQLQNACAADTLTFDTTQAIAVYPATVVSNSIASPNNVFIIDKGRRHGIHPLMGVITHEGVAGIVKATNERYSLVLPLINRQARLSAMIARSGYFGSLRWEGPAPNVALLEDVPGYADVEQGDLIITSGYSAIFPKGIPVGHVTAVREMPGGAFIQLEVALRTDFARLNRVFVLRRPPAPELVSTKIATQQ